MRIHSWKANVLWSPDGPGAAPSAAPAGASSGSSSGGSGLSGPSGSNGSSGTSSFRQPSSPSSSVSDPVPSSSGADGESYDFMSEIFGQQASQAEPAVRAPTAQPAVSQTEPVQQPPGQVPAAAPVDPAQPTSQQPPAVSGQQGEAVTQPGQQQPSSGPRFDPADPISIAHGLEEHQAAAVEALANGVFRLEQKDLEALEVNVGAEVPKLLAKAVVHAQIQFLTMMGKMMPQMLARHSAVTRMQSSAEDSFYRAWPQLDRAKHGRLVAELGLRYRQMNPNDTAEQMIERLGPFALSAAGLPLVAMTRAAAGQQQPQTNGQHQPRPQPQVFQPANPGTVVSTQPVPGADAFGYLGQQE